MFYFSSGLFDKTHPATQWISIFVIVLVTAAGVIYEVTRPIPPDFSREARNIWISECTGDSRSIDDCSRAWDGSRTLRSIYIERAARGER